MKIAEILKQFATVNYVTGIGSSPARVNRKTRDLQLNADKWDNIPESHQAFILLHELSHCLLDSSDEFLVDQLAFKMYADAGYSLKAGVQAVTSLLSDSNDAHRLRAYLQLERAKMYDYAINGNRQVYETNLITKKPNDVCDCNKNSGGSRVLLFDRIGDKSGGLLDNWNGCQEGEKPKVCRKRIRVESKATARENRSEGKRLKGEARATLAEQGIAEANGMDKFKQGVGAIGDAAKGIFGKGGDDGSGGSGGKDNKVLYISLAVGAVVLVLGVVLFAFKK